MTILIYLSLEIFSFILSSILLWVLPNIHPSTSEFPVFAWIQFKQIISIKNYVIVSKNYFYSCSLVLFDSVWSFFNKFWVYLKSSAKFMQKNYIQAFLRFQECSYFSLHPKDQIIWECHKLHSFHQALCKVILENFCKVHIT